MEESILKAVVVDDELHAINLLKRYLNEYDMIEIVATFTDAIEAYRYLASNFVDIVFLDIEMPGINGLEIAHEILNMNHQTEIVFCTAYSQYAVEAFEVNAVDYLLKPIQKERFSRTLDRILMLLKNDANILSDDNYNIKNIYQIQIKSFGEFNLYIETEKSNAIKFRISKAKELLALLNEHIGEKVYKDKILDLLFEEDVETTSKKLHLSTYYLRKKFIEIGFKDQFCYENGFFLLKDSNIQSDAHEFKKLYKKYYQGAEKNVIFLERMLNLYKGNYMEGFYYSWIEKYRAWYEKVALDAAFSLVVHYSKEAQYEKSITLGEWIVQRDPYQEEAYYHIIACYVKMKQLSTAKQRYKSMLDVFKNDLGINLNKELIKKIERELREPL